VKLKVLIIIGVIASITSAVAPASSSATSEPYLFDLLGKPTYQKSWNEMFKGEKNIDRWLARYAKTRNGPATPRSFVQSGGVTYEVSTVCKTHDCEDNIFFVFFSPNGSKAWGLLLKNRAVERFFGNPDENKKRLIRSTVKQ